MFLKSQPEKFREEYKKFLRIAGGLSNLFSDSPVPYLYYRVAEKVFCRAFEAEDLSRSDVSVDARKENLGIGLKTFGYGNGRTFQKVAEFNRDQSIYRGLDPEKLIRKIADLRNARIEFTKNVYKLNSVMYHCVMRNKGKFSIFEEPMEKIDIENIGKIKKKDNSIAFSDDRSEYSFLLSKSTLAKRFEASEAVFELDVKIMKDPLEELRKLFEQGGLLFERERRILQTVFLPLYGRNKTVFPQSGLNQWNANGRKRHSDEVYIPIPAKIHKEFPNFFPDRDFPFELKLPSGDIMRSKVCQDGGKALMSYSNKELGKWILRDVLKLDEGEVLTYEKLQEVGIDTVRIDKISDSEFEINFANLGEYDNFKNGFEEENG